MDYLAVRDRIINRLKNELPVQYLNHNVLHTLDVNDQTIKIATKLKVPEADILIFEL